jgi:TRAP-type C4-dicarboxylate transport system permease small subunit
MDEGQMQQDTTESMDATQQEEDESMSWTWYALIAVAVLGAVYFLAIMFKPKSGSDSE